MALHGMQQAEAAGLVCHNDIWSECDPDSFRKDEGYWTLLNTESSLLLYSALVMSQEAHAASTKPWRRWKRTPKPQMISQFKCQKEQMNNLSSLPTCLPFCFFFLSVPTYQMSRHHV